MAVCFATPLFFSGNISLHSLKLVLLVLSSGGWAGAWGLFLARDGAAGALGRSWLHTGTALLFFLRLLLKSHQVCRNLLPVTLAGRAQVFKPQHCIHPAASLKLVWISFLGVSQQKEVWMLWIISHHHHPAHHRHILIWRWFEMLSFCRLQRFGSIVKKLCSTQGCPILCPRCYCGFFAFF